MNSGRTPRAMDLLIILAGAFAYFGFAVYALIKDSALLGCIFIIGTFAVTALIVTVQKAKERKAEDRLLKYGSDPLPLPESLSLPGDPDSRLAALKILAGDEAGKLADISDDEVLFAAMSGRGMLLRLENGFSARLLCEGINALLEKTGLSGRVPSLIESDILSSGCVFAKSRHEDKLDAHIYDLNAAAYLLRKNGAEPVILFRRAPLLTQGDMPRYLNLALVPAEEMYGLCRLCGAAAAEPPRDTETEQREVRE